MWVINPDGLASPVDGGHDVFHPATFAPHLGGLALALHFIAVDPAWVFDLYEYLVPIRVLDDEVRTVAPHVLLRVNPRDRDAVPWAP